MKRRTFLGVVLGAGAAVAVPMLPILERLLPARCVEAVRVRLYPGPEAKLDPDEVRRPGHWAG